MRSNITKEDTDMIQIFTNLETLVDLTKRFPLALSMDTIRFRRSLNIHNENSINLKADAISN